MEDKFAQHLSDEQRYICIGCGTEPPFSGKYYNHSEIGTYICVCCKQPLFASSTKYESGSGWPSYFDSIANSVTQKPDFSHGMVRTEINCSNCGSHLGHVFDDGPAPTYQRFCVNSLSLDFIKS